MNGLEASGASEAEKEKETPGGKLNPRTAAESQLKLISLPHPATQQATRFALKSVTEDEKNEDENKKPRLFQVQRIHQSAVPRSWFINQECQRDGSLYTLTPFDVCFLLISLMSIPSATSGNNVGSLRIVFHLYISIVEGIIARGFCDGRYHFTPRTVPRLHVIDALDDRIAVGLYL